jgi:uncharacterized membrane protein YGL010W
LTQNGGMLTEPAFLDDVVFLQIGPLFILEKLKLL